MLSHLKTIEQLAIFLGIGENELRNLHPEEHYVCFEIPKPGKDEMRIIEAPKGILKNLLERLADALQWHYSDHRTNAAQGYIRSVVNDPDKRTIFTNASKHLGKKYLLNIDLDNFFHQIDECKVNNIFSDYNHFAFDHDSIELVTDLVCYHGRLPMGSPTSPPLSNFATIELDNDMSRWCNHHKITYTRFVDDLSFSSNSPLTDAHYEVINDILKMHHFLPDPDKIKWFSKNDVKEVTGLIVGKKLSLPPEYITDLDSEIEQLKRVKQYAVLYPEPSVFEWIQKIEKVITGRLAFVNKACGKDDGTYYKLLKKFKQTDYIESAPLSISWRYAGYEYLSS